MFFVCSAHVNAVSEDLRIYDESIQVGQSSSLPDWITNLSDQSKNELKAILNVRISNCEHLRKTIEQAVSNLYSGLATGSVGVLLTGLGCWFLYSNLTSEQHPPDTQTFIMSWICLMSGLNASSSGVFSFLRANRLMNCAIIEAHKIFSQLNTFEDAMNGSM